MDHQDARRARPAADGGSGAHRVLPAGSGAHRMLDPGSGPHRMLDPGSGPHPVLDPGGGAHRMLDPGSGAQQVLDPGSGPHQVLSRTPVRGFPPVPPAPSGPPGREAPEDAFGPWHTPGEPLFTGDGGHAGDPGYEGGAGYAGGPGHDDEDGGHPPAGPVPPASTAPATIRRHGARTARTARPQRRFIHIAWLTAAVLVLAAGVVAGYKFLYEPRVNAPVPSSLRLPTTVPGSPEFDPALGKWQHIATRTTDPEPLTIAQLYPPQFELNGSSYLRTAASATKDCALAVFGADLAAALQSGHCTQVLRASYISGNGTMMGTVGVVNLSTFSAAQKAGQATGPQEIIAPLSSQKGATRKLGQGTGVVQAEIKGHYLILIWAEFANLKSPSTSAQRQLLEQFATNLVTGSANIDLSTRMLTGKASAS